MKINVKKVGSTLEVNLNLAQQCSTPGKEVDHVVITTANLIDALVVEGHKPGKLLTPPANGSNKVSNASWQRNYNLNSVWVFENLDTPAPKPKVLKETNPKPKVLKETSPKSNVKPVDQKANKPPRIKKSKQK